MYTRNLVFHLYTPIIQKNLIYHLYTINIHKLVLYAYYLVVLLLLLYICALIELVLIARYEIPCETKLTWCQSVLVWVCGRDPKKVRFHRVGLTQLSWTDIDGTRQAQTNMILALTFNWHRLVETSMGVDMDWYNLYGLSQTITNPETLKWTYFLNFPPSLNFKCKWQVVYGPKSNLYLMM